MNKVNDFYFQKDGQDNFSIYNIYIKRVNCIAGIERPIGTVELPSGRFKTTAKISITEVYLTLEEHILLMQAIKEQLNLATDTEIVFAA